MVANRENILPAGKKFKMLLVFVWLYIFLMIRQLLFNC
ncbi:Uncharacterized protein ABJ98_2467 [Pseudomonas syringae pv. aceris]|nr:Uncharacterized protein ABJ98_2467 [Pseudomonas syringae pv. aceris]